MTISASDLLAELAKEWNRIEGRAKEAEAIRGEAIVAAINEMRYAGRRIVDSLSPPPNLPEEDIEQYRVDQLKTAKVYLVNADHDITDAIIFVVHTRVNETLQRYGKKKIIKFVPEFDDLFPEIEAAQDIVKGSREDRATRSSEYKRLAEEYIPKIAKLYKRINECEKLKLDNIEFIKKYARTITWIALLGSIASLVGLIPLVRDFYHWCAG